MPEATYPLKVSHKKHIYWGDSGPVQAKHPGEHDWHPPFPSGNVVIKSQQTFFEAP
jgi:hypothetical protein